MISVNGTVKELEQYFIAYQNKKIEHSELKHHLAQIGTYKQRNEKFMVRIRVTGGELLSDKLYTIGKVMEDYSIPFAHLSTRQNIQIHDIPEDCVIPIIKKLSENGFIFKGGGGDTYRNIAACSQSGFCKDESFDVMPYAKALNEFMLETVKAFGLPRKLKIGFSCCESDCSFAKMQDLGFIAKLKDKQKGFAVYCAGGMGRNSSQGIKLFDFIEAQEVFRHVTAVTNLFYDHGDRTDRSKARLRFLLQKLGPKTFSELYKKYLSDTVISTEAPAINLDYLEKTCRTLKSYSDSAKVDKNFDSWKTRAIADEKEDLLLLRLFIPFANLTGRDFYFLHDLAREFCTPFVRLTRDQRILLPIHKTALKNMYSMLVNYSGKDFTGTSFVGNISSCIGAKVCQIGMIDSPGLALSIAESLDKAFEKYPELKTRYFLDIVNSIKISGCHNSCGNHLMAPLGLQGIKKKDVNGISDYCNIYCNARDNMAFTPATTLPITDIPEFLLIKLKKCLT